MTERPLPLTYSSTDQLGLRESPESMTRGPADLFPPTHESRVSAMDPLSDVLRAVRLNGAYFYYVEAGAPWSVSANPACDLVPRILPDAEHLISYHILLAGTCWGGLEGERQVRLEPGDVIVFPHGDSHIMSSDKGHRDESGIDGTSAKRYPQTVKLGPVANRDTKLV